MMTPRCDHHDEYDEHDRPVGDACNAPATHRIFWDDGFRLSYGCAAHLLIDADASVKPAKITLLSDEPLTVDERIALLEADLIKVAPVLDMIFNPDKEELKQRNVGFLLCAFDFGEKGALAFVSTAQVDDIKNAIDELKGKLDKSARTVQGDR